jgi:hypothetical protein
MEEESVDDDANAVKGELTVQISTVFGDLKGYESRCSPSMREAC